MTAARYLLGVALLLGALVPVVGGSRAWRRRLLPHQSGVGAVLSTSVLSISLVLVVAEVLGTAHCLALWPVAVVTAAAGGLGWYAADRWWLKGGQRTDSKPEPPKPQSKVTASSVATRSLGHRGGRSMNLMAVVATAVVTADWAARTIDALNHGINTIDSVWYHQPFAARFVQQESITAIQTVDFEPVVQYYPANSELLHALGIIFLGNDLLSAVINMAWMAMVLAAAWCIGRRYGVAPVALVGAALLLGTPGLVATQPGGGYNDVVGLALFLTALAILVETQDGGRHPSLGGVVIAALASGLAFGTKFTFVGPVVILTIGVVVLCPRGLRLRRGLLWVALAGLTGAYWYVRNWVAVGNPLPSLSHLGPFSLRSPPISAPTSTFGKDLFNGHFWLKYFIPGLRSSLGPGWVVGVGGSIIGCVLVIVSRRSLVVRMAGVVGLGCFVVFIWTPQFLGTRTAPTAFYVNLRYAAPAFAVGLVLLPLAPVLSRGRRPIWVGGALLATLVVTQLDSTIWPGHLFAGPFAKPVSDTDSLAGAFVGVAVLAVGVASLRAARQLRPRASVSKLVRYLPVLTVLAVFVVGYPLQQFYLDHRYTSGAQATLIAPKMIARVQAMTNQRIAVSGGYTVLQYPYYGRNLSNYVQYLIYHEADGALRDFATCHAFVQALEQGRYDYLVTMSPLEEQWMRSDPDAVRVSDERNVATYRLGNHRGEATACGSAAPEAGGRGT